MPAPSAQMRKVLEKLVIAPLREQGFEGKYPHFRRVASEERIELLCFQKDKYGGAFFVEGAVIFPKEETSQRRNFSFYEGCETLEKVTAEATNVRHRLKGMYDGSFAYADVYTKWVFLTGRVYAIGENTLRGGKTVQKSGEETCIRVAEEVNRQMKDMHRWYAQLQTADDLNKHRK